MDEVEKSIRRIVSESNVNVLTKRMVRAEYMRQHNMAILSSQHKEAIGKVLDAIVQELGDLLKKGHSMESLKLHYNNDCPETCKSNSKSTDSELNGPNTEVFESKDLNTVGVNKDLDTVVEHKDLNTIGVNKDLNTVVEHKDLNTVGVNKDLNTVVEHKDLNTIGVNKDLNTVFENKDLNLEIVEDKVLNSKELDSTQEHINVSSKINDSPSKLNPRNMKADTFKRKRDRLFTADEVRDCITLIDSDDQSSQETNCSWNFSPPKERTFDHSWEEDVALLPTNISRPSHECKPIDQNSFKVSSPSSSQSSIADSAEVIVIDSSPERDHPSRTKSRSEGRNWLSLFSEEEAKAIMVDDRLAYDRDSAFDTEPALLSRKRHGNSSPTKRKTSCFDGDTLMSSTEAKKEKNTLSSSGKNGIDTLPDDNAQTFFNLKNTAQNKNFYYYDSQRESPSQKQLKSISHDNLTVSVRLTPINADNVETIIDLTK